MTSKHKKLNVHFSKTRFIIGLAGAVCSIVTFIFTCNYLSSIGTLGLAACAVFFLLLIFSLDIALCATTAIALIGLIAILPKYWLQIIGFFAGSALIFLLDESRVKEWLFHRNSTKISSKKKRFYDARSELYKTLGIFCAFTAWIFPNSNTIFVGLAIVISLLSVIRLLRYPNRINLRIYKEGGLSSTASLLLISSILMSLGIITNQNYPNLLWLIMGVFALFWIVLFLIFNKEYKNQISIALQFIVIISIFSFSAINSVNRAYDFYPANQYETKVVSKSTSGKKHKSHYVKITTFPDMKIYNDIEVSFDIYEKTSPGDRVYIMVHQGVFGAEWYKLFTEPNKEYEIQKSNF